MTDEEIARKIQEVDDRSRSNTKRLNEVELKLQDNSKMLENIARISQRQDDMESDLKEIKSDVKMLTGKPAQRWESIVNTIILGIVGALVAAALAVFGLN